MRDLFPAYMLRKGHVRTQREGGVFEPEPNQAGTLISDFQPPKL